MAVDAKNNDTVPEADPAPTAHWVNVCEQTGLVEDICGCRTCTRRLSRVFVLR